MTTVATLGGSAAELHARPLEAGPLRVEVLEVDGPALVLGSTQPGRDVDVDAAAAAGVAVARRRSGGGAVLLEPGRHTWLDLTIGRDDRRWRDDVAVAFHWVGDAWATALADLGVEGTQVHRGPLRTTTWSRLLCFAGVGPGEVLGADGRKLVGVSQRRTRQAARFQCLVLRECDPAAVVGLLALDETGRSDAARALASGAGVVDAAPGQLVEALVAALGA